MDLLIKAERAWMIPYKVFSALLKLHQINDYSIDELTKVSLENYQGVFTKYYNKNLHRYNYMAGRFRDAVLLIKNRYQSNAALIWQSDKPPSSSDLVKRFRQFNGVGQKISTMAVNTLVRRYNVKLSDYRDIDMSIDSQIVKVMKRLGFVANNTDEITVKKKILEQTRYFYPEYPGIFDKICWFAGRDYCHEKSPNCQNCILEKICRKVF
jgi:endonuclease III-like uncharacterized protein